MSFNFKGDIPNGVNIKGNVALWCYGKSNGDR